MKFNELQTLWKTQTTTTPRDLAKELKKVRQRAVIFRRRVIIRDITEISAGLLIIGFFSYTGYYAPLTVFLGCLAVIAAAGFVTLYFLFDRRTQQRRPRPPGAEVESELRRALDDLDHQIDLLGRVSEWYLGPLVIGETLFGLSVALVSPSPWWSWLPLYIGICGGVYFAVRWLNHSTVRKKLRPEREQLARVLADWQALRSTETDQALGK